MGFLRDITVLFKTQILLYPFWGLWKQISEAAWLRPVMAAGVMRKTVITYYFFFFTEKLVFPVKIPGNVILLNILKPLNNILKTRYCQTST